MECQHESGGFGGNIRHDPQIVHTLNAVQVLTSFDKLNAFDIDKITNYIDGFTPHTCMTSLYSSHIHFLYSHTSCLLYPSSSMLTTHIFIFSNHPTNPFLTLPPHHPFHPWTRSLTDFSHFLSLPVALLNTNPPMHGHPHFSHTPYPSYPFLLLLLIFGSFPTYIKSYAHNHPQGSPHHHPPMLFSSMALDSLSHFPFPYLHGTHDIFQHGKGGNILAWWV